MNIRAAALVPAAPLLVPALTGEVPTASDARAAALACIGDVLTAGVSVVVIAATGESTRSWPSDAPLRLDRLGGLGLGDGDATPVPIPLALGATLVRDAGWAGEVRYLTIDASDAAATINTYLDAHESIGLVVLGNGSARCTEKAPGSFDAGAEAFNTSLLDAVTRADSDALAALDLDEARAQWSDIAGSAALLASTLDDSFVAHVHFADVVNGVFYVCASFT